MNAQICLTHTVICAENEKYYQGVGSLKIDWSKNPYDQNGNLKLRHDDLNEFDFSVFNNDLRDSYFYEMYQAISKKFTIGRCRIILLPPKKCMSWHKDSEKRLHFAIQTDNSCRMVIEEESLHIQNDGQAILCDTTKMHTAFNGSHKLDRYHLVIGVKEKSD